MSEHPQDTVSVQQRSGHPPVRHEGTPVLAPGHTFGSVTDHISAIVLTRQTPRGWYLGFALAFILVMLLFYTI
ncbi:MAG: hypothetical protein FJZ47_25390, partial [Candidatus Tectomicrobia bacterium]|nr:hypothetical protein [Candidatus Tectomicrobia bacterium]